MVFKVFCSGAMRDNMFPYCRKGSLCPDILEQLGCSWETMMSRDGFPDALFFYQLLLPIGDTSLNDNDPWMNFYYEVGKLTNHYAIDIGQASGYGHGFKHVTAPELVHYNGILVQDGVGGGTDGAILCCFQKTKLNTAYDPLISKSMTKNCFVNIKRSIKLNNIHTTPKKGQPD